MGKRSRVNYTKAGPVTTSRMVDGQPVEVSRCRALTPAELLRARSSVRGRNEPDDRAK